MVKLIYHILLGNLHLLVEKYNRWT